MKGEKRRRKGIGLPWINLAAKEPTGGVKALARLPACVRAYTLLHKVDISKIDGRLFGICRPGPAVRNTSRARRAAGAPPPDLLAKSNICEPSGGREGKAWYLSHYF